MANGQGIFYDDKARSRWNRDHARRGRMSRSAETMDAREKAQVRLDAGEIIAASRGQSRTERVSRDEYNRLVESLTKGGPKPGS